MSCWYCGGRLTKPRREARPTDASVEHLLALDARGKDMPGNRVDACRRCNIFVNKWKPELKYAFRRLMRSGGPDPRSRPRREIYDQLHRELA